MQKAYNGVESVEVNDKMITIHLETGEEVVYMAQPQNWGWDARLQKIPTETSNLTKDS